MVGDGGLVLSTPDVDRHQGTAPAELGPDPGPYFEALRETHARAAASAGGILDHWITVAGRGARLRFAGSALVPALTPALTHLACEPGPAPGLTVRLWDSASTGTRMLAPPWPGEPFGPRGEIRGYNTGRFRAAFQHGASSLHMLDTERAEAVYWIRDAAAVPYWETGAPLRTILHWWTARQGLQLVHAAAVGTAAGGALLAGKAGSGKSTTALACLEAGFTYAGDDYVLLDAGPPPVVHSLYASAKLNADHVHAFPRLRPAVRNGDRLATEKALLLVNDRHPDRLVRALPVRTVLLPRVTGRRGTAVRRISPAAALAALAPSTIFQLPGAGRDAFRYLGRLVALAPAYVLEVGTDLDEIPRAVRGLLEGD